MSFVCFMKPTSDNASTIDRQAIAWSRANETTYRCKKKYSIGTRNSFSGATRKKSENKRSEEYARSPFLKPCVMCISTLVVAFVTLSWKIQLQVFAMYGIWCRSSTKQLNVSRCSCWWRSLTTFSTIPSEYVGSIVIDEVVPGMCKQMILHFAENEDSEPNMRFSS